MMGRCVKSRGSKKKEEAKTTCCLQVNKAGWRVADALSWQRNRASDRHAKAVKRERAA